MSLKPDGSQAISNIRFAREFLKSPLKTGAVAASSQHLVDAMVNEVDFATSRSIVELGPGSGVVTEGLVARLQGDTHFFSLELNPSFAAETQKRCPGTIVEIGCATTLAHRLRTFGIEKTDCVVSALPWTLFDGNTQDSVLCAIRESLSAEGRFVFYTYKGIGFMPASIRLRKYLRKHFSNIQKTTTVWNNLPPAIVYRCFP